MKLCSFVCLALYAGSTDRPVLKKSKQPWSSNCLIVDDTLAVTKIYVTWFAKRDKCQNICDLICKKGPLLSKY